MPGPVGSTLVGVTGADDFAVDREAALDRIRDGRMDGLPWYTESRVVRGTSPEELLPGARSVICLGLSYFVDSSDGGWNESEDAWCWNGQGSAVRLGAGTITGS